MKLTKLLGYMTAAAVGYAVLSNMADIKRYIRITHDVISRSHSGRPVARFITNEEVSKYELQ